jgi:hypothetical protein
MPKPPKSTWAIVLFCIGAVIYKIGRIAGKI